MGASGRGGLMRESPSSRIGLDNSRSHRMLRDSRDYKDEYDKSPGGDFFEKKHHHNQELYENGKF